MTITKERPILFNGNMVRAILAGRKTVTRRPLKEQPPDECSIHYPIGNESWLSAPKRKPLTHEWEAWGGPLYAARPEGHLCGVFDAKSPFGSPGDQLWVRETWADVNCEGGPALLYRSDGDLRDWRQFSESYGPDCGAGPSMDYDAYPGDYCMWWSDLWAGAEGHGWRPSIHMPRWASRITLRVLDVRVERLQEIDDEGAIAELGLRSVSSGELSSGRPLDDFVGCWNSIYAAKGLGWDDNPWVWVCEFERVEAERLGGGV